MYHYIKNYNNNKIFNLKSLDLKKFEEQIIFFKKNTNILNNDDFCQILYEKKIPKKPCTLLTFDDGYNDHYENVYPLLLKYKIKGIFYPVANNFENNFLLDVNKIQIILANTTNKKKLLYRIFFFIKKYTGKNIDQLNINSINLSSRFDSKSTILIKRLLQYHLEKNIRKMIINNIFEETFNNSNKNIFSNFYLNTQNAQEMFNDGMAFGVHGYDHYWLNHLNKKEQENELKLSINLLKKKNLFNDNLSICYPYGGYNNNTLDIVKNLKVKFAVTTVVGNLNINNLNRIYEICRYDCNDFLN
jgi:peptidoglycan/xylan/chitin deacetylase (PgdA/CDA1 family)